MEITGTVEDQDGGQRRAAAQGATCEDAKAALEAMIPEGNKLTVIRTF